MPKDRGQSRDGLVYSTRHGKMCPGCRRPITSCSCSCSCSCASTQESPGAPSDGIVRVQRVTKGRRGKGVTLITGVPLGREELAELAQALKKRCGTGGTVKQGNIEIQGDHRDVLVEELKKKGWTVKRAGG